LGRKSTVPTEPRKRRRMDKPNPRPAFVTDYPTMFKIESRPRPTILLNGKGRLLQCVACSHLMTWRIYRTAIQVFDKRCPKCGVTAADYWKNRPHKEFTDA
jgi:hypothetical protein